MRAYNLTNATTGIRERSPSATYQNATSAAWLTSGPPVWEWDVPVIPFPTLRPRGGGTGVRYHERVMTPAVDAIDSDEWGRRED